MAVAAMRAKNRYHIVVREKASEGEKRPGG
jgi:hypothetical protein